MKKQNKILLSVTAVIVIVVFVLKVAGSFSSSEESTSSALGYEMSAFDGVSPPSVAIDIFNSLDTIVYDFKCTDHYERKSFKHWSSTDASDGEPAGTSLNTRHNELQRESLIAVEYNAERSDVVEGTWDLVYKQGTTNSPSDLDSEHGLPLANIFCREYSANGGNPEVRDAEWREAIANDPVLVFSADKYQNRKRGAASWGPSPYNFEEFPDGWFPNNADVHCPWLALQGEMLKKYGLGVTEQERDKAVEVLEGCIS